MIVIDTYQLAPTAGGDPSKPGAWTRDEIEDWNRAAACDHAAFHALDTPLRPLEECPSCNAVLRTRTDRQGWVDHHAEQRAEQRAHNLALLEDRENGR